MPTTTEIMRELANGDLTRGGANTLIKAGQILRRWSGHGPLRGREQARPTTAEIMRQLAAGAFTRGEADTLLKAGRICRLQEGRILKAYGEKQALQAHADDIAAVINADVAERERAKRVGRTMASIATKALLSV